MPQKIVLILLNVLILLSYARFLLINIPYSGYYWYIPTLWTIVTKLQNLKLNNWELIKIAVFIVHFNITTKYIMSRMVFWEMVLKFLSIKLKIYFKPKNTLFSNIIFRRVPLGYVRNLLSLVFWKGSYLIYSPHSNLTNYPMSFSKPGPNSGSHMAFSHHVFCSCYSGIILWSFFSP